MSDPARFMPKVLNALGNLLVVAGALVLFLGDRLLREAGHWDFWNAEIVGIGTSLIIILLGALLRMAAKKKKPAG